MLRQGTLPHKGMFPWGMMRCMTEWSSCLMLLAYSTHKEYTFVTYWEQLIMSVPTTLLPSTTPSRSFLAVPPSSFAEIYSRPSQHYPRKHCPVRRHLCFGPWRHR